MAGNWEFLTNHAHVLVCVANDPGVRLRDIAETVGITERGAHKILAQLIGEGYVRSERVGRRNRYEVHTNLPMRHPQVQEREIGDLLELLLKQRRGKDRAVAAGKVG
jgi:DNA-binding MarR family transcriptional regulator